MLALHMIRPRFRSLPLPCIAIIFITGGSFFQCSSGWSVRIPLQRRREFAYWPTLPPLQGGRSIAINSPILLNAKPYRYDDIIDEEYVVEEVSDDGTNTDPTAPPTNTRKRTKAQLRQDLRDELKEYRIEKTSTSNKQPYTVFPHAALEDICRSIPTTYQELLQVKGIGPKKKELYGDDILVIVQRYSEQGLLPTRSAAVNKMKVSSSTKKKTTTKSAKVPRPDSISLSSLTKEQKQVAQWALDETTRPNVFISGAAGVGKSHVVKYIVQTLQKQARRTVGVCAPTGVAAWNVGGSTLHSFFGIGLGSGSLSGILKKVHKNREALQRIRTTDTIVIDEVSMLSSSLMETLDAVAQEIRNRHEEPFGGMQVIAVGDFFQLPPVYKKTYSSSFWGDDEDDQDRDAMRPYCFGSYVWSELGLVENTFELQEVQRQAAGSKFVQFLHMVRKGSVTPSILYDFNEKCVLSSKHPLPTDGIVPTRLYTLNRDVDEENEACLMKLDGPEECCRARDEWKEDLPADATTSFVSKAMKDGIAAELPDEVRLKVGAQVMLTRNKDVERGLVNGSRGVVERFVSSGIGGGSQKVPVVRFDCGITEKIAPVEAQRFNPDGGAGCLIRKQVPLRLAWAMTIHKSQGTTLSRVILDIGSTFEPGQAYVSLSRVQSIEGLWLERPVRMHNIMVSQRVVDYYNGLSSLDIPDSPVPTLVQPKA